MCWFTHSMESSWICKDCGIVLMPEFWLPTCQLWKTILEGCLLCLCICFLIPIVNVLMSESTRWRFIFSIWYCQCRIPTSDVLTFGIESWECSLCFACVSVDYWLPTCQRRESRIRGIFIVVGLSVTAPNVQCANVRNQRLRVLLFHFILACWISTTNVGRVNIGGEKLDRKLRLECRVLSCHILFFS